ncbi:benzyl alcohol dehydrogenase [Gracilibacillus halophilus YIM-C55.5]|uniref:Benzyl alcohol dehydrogenase n=1 Tax=Gracilibacillus halophilus YIM-C55.5 TaxID=1308866 RepID=N4W9Z7_9BACI|nr:benzyl alcohol dehydrogenase [Gracilibacillus halophilus YIM-C55.5]
MKIKAAVTYSEGDAFEIEEVDLQEPKANEVLVKVVASGICHTDLIVRDQHVPGHLPAVLGHEGSGVVEKVGENVTEVEPGDHVGLSFSSCGKCESCRRGAPYACVNMFELNFGGNLNDGTKRLSKDGQELGTFFGQSSFSTYAVAHERNVVKVDSDIDLNIVGPLGCGIQTGSGAVLEYLQPEVDSSITIFGCGTVGLSAVMAAKLTGASHIIAVDLQENRLELAQELGATDIINGNEANVVETIRDITDGGVNYGVDTTGAPPVFKQALHSLGVLGHLVVVGATGETDIRVHDDLVPPNRTVSGW